MRLFSHRYRRRWKLFPVKGTGFSPYIQATRTFGTLAPEGMRRDLHPQTLAVNEINRGIRGAKHYSESHNRLSCPPRRIMSLNNSLSRRGFLGASAAIAATAALTGSPQASAESAASTPPAIAALPVLSGLARPFTNDERLARITRAQRLMHAAKIDAVVLANSTTSSVYFADLRLNGGERFCAL